MIVREVTTVIRMHLCPAERAVFSGLVDSSQRSTPAFAHDGVTFSPTGEYKWWKR